MQKPAQIAEVLRDAGVTKVQARRLQTVVLGFLAGLFIAFGCMIYTVAITDTGLGYGPTRLLGGLSFSLGLILVVVGGAELFTGNTLLTVAWVGRRITLRQLAGNWTVVFLANAVGALVAVAMVQGAAILGQPGTGETAAAIARSKLALTPGEAFLRGLLCNTLVCLGVWLGSAANDVTGKILSIIFPITAFVALGFEHSIANLYLIPTGMLEAGSWDTMALLANLVPVTLGNIVGGAVFVGLVYWLAFLRAAPG
jgi:formate/nitrite transporter